MYRLESKKKVRKEHISKTKSLWRTSAILIHHFYITI